MFALFGINFPPTYDPTISSHEGVYSVVFQFTPSILYNLQKNCEAFKQYNMKQMKVAKKREALLEHQIEKEKKRDEREEEGKRRKVVGQWEWLKNIVFY
jgi:hypothetical protein